MPFGRKSPLEALALPGVILAYRYSQFRARRREAASRRVTERELSALHHKIDKLLNKLEESEPEPPTSQEDECVICVNARATIQTSPCDHRVVCRRCFVKTIQSAVAQRLLPLRCVICRARINRLTSSCGSVRLQGSASAYSMGSKSWNVPGSASSYSVGARVAQSSSLYSMSSGSSCLSGTSDGVSTSSGSSGSSSSTRSSVSATSLSPLSSLSSARSDSSMGLNKLHHHLQHNGAATCPPGCLGAIPRTHNTTNLKRNSGQPLARGRASDISNRLPTIKEFRSPAKMPNNSPAHLGNSRIRFASYTTPLKSDAQSMLAGKTSMASCGSTPSPQILATATVATAGLHQSQKGSAKLLAISNSRNGNGGGVKTSAPVQRVVKSPPIIINKIINGTTMTTTPTLMNGGGGGGVCGLQDERADNRKNEMSAERRKKEEKARLKAEREAKKEEKRIAKEEERLAKMLAKEEKKKSKKEAKELLLGNDSGRK